MQEKHAEDLDNAKKQYQQVIETLKDKLHQANQQLEDEQVKSSNER